MKIYLAGKVPKGDEEAKTFDNWRLKYAEVLEKIFDAECIDPHGKHTDESDCLEVVGNDCYKIKKSDLIVVCAEGKLGAGTAQEFVIAKYFKKPVITVLPKNSHHRRPKISFQGKKVSDWIHPFIFTFSDFVVEDVKEIEAIKDKIFSSKIKDISLIDEAIDYVSKNHQ